MEPRDPLWAHRLMIDACLEEGVPFFWRTRGTMLIAGSGVAAVLRRVLASGRAELLGFEGFELEGSHVQPRIDLIFDVELRPDADPLAIVASWGEGLWIDVTLRPVAGTP